MTFRRVLVIGAAVALTAACSKTEPIMLASPTPNPSDTRGSTATGSPESTSADSEGRYIARCTTEANGDGAPGTTYFTDGSQGITDYCLRRYYIGVQPAPGAVYVPDEDSSGERPAPEQRGENGVRGDAPQSTPQGGEDFFALGQAPQDNLGAAAASPQRPNEGNGNATAQNGGDGENQNATTTTGADQSPDPGEGTILDQQPGIPGLPQLPDPEQIPGVEPTPTQPGTTQPGTGDVPGENTVPGTGGVGGDQADDLPPGTEPAPAEPEQTGSAPTGSQPIPGSSGSGWYLPPVTASTVPAPAPAPADALSGISAFG